MHKKKQTGDTCTVWTVIDNTSGYILYLLVKGQRALWNSGDLGETTINHLHQIKGVTHIFDFCTNTESGGAVGKYYLKPGN